MTGALAELTSKGLVAHWHARGRAMLILRIDMLGDAARGPLLKALQDLLAAYEEACRLHGVQPGVLPAAMLPAAFVGGNSLVPGGTGSFLRELLAAVGPHQRTAETGTHNPTGA